MSESLLHFALQRFDLVIEALEKGQAVDLGGLPPSPQGEEHNMQANKFRMHNHADAIYAAASC